MKTKTKTESVSESASAFGMGIEQKEQKQRKKNDMEQSCATVDNSGITVANVAFSGRAGKSTIGFVVIFTGQSCEGFGKFQ